MPDKNFACRGKGHRNCTRCWRNKLKHGNKLKKKNFPKQNVWYTNESEYSKSEEEEEEPKSFFDEWFDTYVTIPRTYDKATYIPLNTIFNHYRNWLSETKKIHTNNIIEFRKKMPKTESKRDVGYAYFKNKYQKGERCKTYRIVLK